MFLSLSWLLLTLNGPATGAAPATSAPTAPAAAPSANPEARAEQAAALYQQRKYAEAAQILEDLWAQVHEPRDLFNAGLARLALGHRAHAIRYWELYLQQPQIPEDGRQQALERIKKAQAAATGIIVRPAPAALAEIGVTLAVTRVDERRPDLTIDLPPHATEFSSGGRTLYLDPGKWQLKVSAPAYVTSTRDIQLKPGASGYVLDVPLAADPAFRVVTIQLEPADAVSAGAQVSLQKVTLGAEPVPCPLDKGGRCIARVEPGDWEVTVQASGYQRHVEKLSLGAPGSANLAIALAPAQTAAASPPPEATPPVTAPPAEGAEALPPVVERVPRKTRLRLSAGLITAGIPVFISGLAIAVHGSNVYDEKKLTLKESGDLLPGIRLRAAGTGLMGAAVGLFATGLTAEYDVKPWVWWTELGVGAAALLGGATWVAVSSTRWNSNRLDTLVCNNNSGLDCFTAHRLGAGFFLGVGASLVVGATTGLLVQRKYPVPRRVSFSPTFGAGQGGVLLSGRF